MKKNSIANSNPALKMAKKEAEKTKHFLHKPRFNKFLERMVIKWMGSLQRIDFYNNSYGGISTIWHLEVSGSSYLAI